MPLIIDGYNLLHASGILGRGIGPGGLERSRLALLNFLAEALDDCGRSTTTVVFDGREAPPGLPRKFDYRGLKVLFAARNSDADAAIEELIRASSSPRTLTVVSSDHRLHRAARRRKAKPIDSDRWYEAILRERRQRLRPLGGARGTTETTSAAEVEYWLRQFGIEPPAPSSEPTAASPLHDNPFPPGYAEDIREQDV